MIWGAAPLSVPMPEALSGSVELIGRPALSGLPPRHHRGRARRRRCLLYVLVNHTRVGMLVRAGAIERADGLGARRRHPAAVHARLRLRRHAGGFAGAMVAPILSVEPGMGDNILILAFVVIVIGGIGSIRGAFLAALLVGLVDTLGPLLRARSCCALVLDPVGREPDRPGARADADLHPDGGDPVLPAGRPVPGEAMSASSRAPRRPRPRRRARPARRRARRRSSSSRSRSRRSLAQLGAEGYILSLLTRVMIFAHRRAVARSHPRLRRAWSASATRPSSASAPMRSASCRATASTTSSSSSPRRSPPRRCSRSSPARSRCAPRASTSS